MSCCTAESGSALPVMLAPPHTVVPPAVPQLTQEQAPQVGRALSGEHITLAWGRDFSDVTPMRGVILGGGDQELAVAVTVTPE